MAEFHRYVNSLIRPETAPRPGKEELVQEALGGPREVDWNGEGDSDQIRRA